MRLILLALSVALVQLASFADGQQFQCQSEGFFVDPNDCSKFVRCVDTFQSGRFQVFKFDCPAGKLMKPVDWACEFISREAVAQLTNATLNC